jgi:hypothetical protein
MITRIQFNNIYREVEQSVNHAFDFLQNNAQESAYFTFLAEGEYNVEIPEMLTPYRGY